MSIPHNHIKPFREAVCASDQAFAQHMRSARTPACQRPEISALISKLGYDLLLSQMEDPEHNDSNGWLSSLNWSLETRREVSLSIRDHYAACTYCQQLAMHEREVEAAIDRVIAQPHPHSLGRRIFAAFSYEKIVRGLTPVRCFVTLLAVALSGSLFGFSWCVTHTSQTESNCPVCGQSSRLAKLLKQGEQKKGWQLVFLGQLNETAASQFPSLRSTGREAENQYFRAHLTFLCNDARQQGQHDIGNPVKNDREATVTGDFMVIFASDYESNSNWRKALSSLVNGHDRKIVDALSVILCCPPGQLLSQQENKMATQPAR